MVVKKEGVSEGKRNTTGFKLAISLRREGINNEQELLKELTDWNLKNNPPLEETELKQIISSSLKYEIKTKNVEKKKYIEPADEEDVVRTSSIIINGIMYEQGYNPETQQVYFFDNTEKVDTSGNSHYNKVMQITHNGIVYKPLIGEELQKNVVLLPTHPHTYIDIEELLQKIQQHIHKYCDVTEEFEKLASYYVLISYVYDQFTEIPYLSMMGDIGTGKTRVRDVIGMICYKPIITNGGASPAALYRITEKWKGTVLIDEADIKDSDEQNDIIKYFNCGYQRNSPVMKCDKNDPNKIQFFNPYCPKIITRRQPFEDKATESRCINEIMQTTNRKDIPFNLPNQFFVECLHLRNKLTCFRLNCWKNYQNISVEDINLVFSDLQIEPRLKQASNAVIYLLKPFPDLLFRFKQYLVKKQIDLIYERSESFDGEIINALYDLLVVAKRDDKTLTSKDIAELLNKDVYDVRQKITPEKIGRRLKSLNIKVNKPKWFGNDKLRTIVVDSGKMAELFKKYVIDYQNYGTVGTDGTVIWNTPENCSNMQTNGLERVEPVLHISVPSVPTVPNRHIKEKNNNYVTMVEWCRNNDRIGNDVELFEKFDEKLIQQALNNGLLFQHKPNWYKLT